MVINKVLIKEEIGKNPILKRVLAFQKELLFIEETKINCTIFEGIENFKLEVKNFEKNLTERRLNF